MTLDLSDRKTAPMRAQPHWIATRYETEMFRQTPSSGAHVITLELVDIARRIAVQIEDRHDVKARTSIYVIAFSFAEGPDWSTQTFDGARHTARAEAYLYRLGIKEAHLAMLAADGDEEPDSPFVAQNARRIQLRPDLVQPGEGPWR